MKHSFQNQPPLLEIKGLKVKFPARKQLLTAVDGVDLQIRPGEIVGVVGESGSGKSVMSQSILRLREYDSAVEYEGEILFEGKDILKLSQKEMRSLRGNRIAVIFQDPMTSLSPVHTVGKQMSEVLLLHKRIAKTAARERCLELLKLVGIANPEDCCKKYPYELSGGMQQRVMIAMALAGRPRILIADEPTTALDVTIQAQILDLIRKLNRESDTAVLMITHDLGVVNELCDRVIVMYTGRIMEEASTDDLFREPLHPYTIGLLNSIPKIEKEKKALPTIPGMVPNPTEEIKGCSFCPRCDRAMKICGEEEPPVVEMKGRRVRCWRYTGKEEERNG